MKKILTIIIVMTLIFSMNSISFAVNENGELTTTPKPTLIPTEDGTSSSNKSSDTSYSISNISPSGALEATKSDMEYWATITKKAPISPSNPPKTTWIPLSPFYYYAQELAYSCGPASVKMALKYITGTIYSEATIRTGCNTTTSGTYLSDMASYTNDEQSDNTYVVRYQQTQLNMVNHLYSGIVTFDASPLIGVAFTTADGWDFNTSGHFLAIYSVKSDKSEYAIADPWGGYGSTTEWYDKSAGDLYDAYDSVNIGYMY